MRSSLYSFFVVSYKQGNFLTASISCSLSMLDPAMLSIASIVLVRLNASKLKIFNFAA